MNQAAFLDLRTPDLVLALLAALLLLGNKMLPELTRSLGTSMRKLRKDMNDTENENTNKKSEEPKQESS